MKEVILNLLIFYKRYLSRGYGCRFVPSCSEYTYEAVRKYGVIEGLWMGVKRIGKCHWWHKGGIDLVK